MDVSFMQNDLPGNDCCEIETGVRFLYHFLPIVFCLRLLKLRRVEMKEIASCIK